MERGVRNLEFVLQQMHSALMALTSYEANDIVANSRKSLLEAWRRLQKRYDPTTGGSFLLDGALFWDFMQGSNAGNPACRATRRS